jgi:hypothetical protein
MNCKHYRLNKNCSLCTKRRLTNLKKRAERLKENEILYKREYESCLTYHTDSEYEDELPERKYKELTEHCKNLNVSVNFSDCGYYLEYQGDSFSVIENQIENLIAKCKESGTFQDMYINNDSFNLDPQFIEKFKEVEIGQEDNYIYVMKK